jgi:hypothetical protein
LAGEVSGGQVPPAGLDRGRTPIRRPRTRRLFEAEFAALRYFAL